MFPFRDHNPSSRFPYVSYALIAINVIVFLLYGFRDEQFQWNVYMDWALVPAEVTAGDELFTFITAMFMHGGIMHLAGNMLFLYVFGDNLEDYLGHVGYLVFYLICGIAASWGQIVIDPLSEVPNLGASGAIAGLMGGYLVLFPKARVDCMLILIIIIKMITLSAMIVLGAWLALQIIGGVSAWGVPGGGVAYWAHIGGFFAGIAFILMIWTVRGVPQNWPEMPHPEAAPVGPWSFASKS